MSAEEIKNEIKTIKENAKKKDFKIEEYNMDLRLYYIESVEGSKHFLTDILYYEKTADNKLILLGAFSKKFGMVNRNYERFIGHEDVTPGSNFFENHLRGISIDTLDTPLRFCGVALSTEGSLYETEALAFLDIDAENHTLTRWHQVWW